MPDKRETEMQLKLFILFDECWLATVFMNCSFGKDNVAVWKHIHMHKNDEMYFFQRSFSNNTLMNLSLGSGLVTTLD